MRGHRLWPPGRDAFACVNLQLGNHAIQQSAEGALDFVAHLHHFFMVQGLIRHFRHEIEERIVNYRSRRANFAGHAIAAE